jgi:ubiquinone/menaquinone biosynthesis C-methylase UbiE
MSFAYMKVLETAPERYDRGMALLTLGRWRRVHQDIAGRLEPGSEVLDLGCGTGALAVMLARQGIRVTGVDADPAMLAEARQRLREEGLESQVTLQELGAVDLDTAFGAGVFDAIASSLLFSELSADEIAYTLAQCRRSLRSGGRLLVADEVLPDSTLGRVGAFFFRLPFVVLAFVLTQNTTHQVADLGSRIAEAGFNLLEEKGYLAGTLRLFVAEKG